MGRDRALLIGNSRGIGPAARHCHGGYGSLPWSHRDDLRFEPQWGPYLAAHGPQDLRIRLEDVPAKSPPWLRPSSGARMAWRCSQAQQLDCSRGLLLVDAGTVLSLTRVTPDGCFAGGQLIPGYRLQLRAMAQGTMGLPSTQELSGDGVADDVIPRQTFPYQTLAAMQRGVLEAMLATIAAAQQHSQGLLWICGGDAALLKRHWSGPTELLQLEGDLQLQALLSLGAGLSSGRDR